LMALRTTGARVARAEAAAGVHPSYPGTPIAGVVSVFVVPPLFDAGPPLPTEAELRAVAEHLSTGAGPAGVESVAAAPNYRRIRAEVGIVVDPAYDAAAARTFVIDTIDTYLDPLRGGANASGWPFGETLVYVDLLRRLISPQKGIRAVRRLRLVVDGRRQPPCADVKIGPYDLFWPMQHEVLPEEETAA
jgi:hypothetical protein